MKNKLRLTEVNLISLIKRVLLEQTTQNNKPAYSGMGDDDISYLQQQQTASQQQQTVSQQQPATTQQQSVNYCEYGYQKVDKGPYFVCSESENIKPLQQALKVNPDGKFGTNTLRAVFAKFKKISVTDDDIKTIAPNAKTPLANAAPNAQTTTNQQLSTGGLVLKINKNTKSLGVINQAYTKGGKIILTNNKGDGIYDTTCQLLTTKPAKFNSLSQQSIGYVQSINDQGDNGIVTSIYNYFCKNTNRIDVTKVINDDLNNPNFGLKTTYPTIKLRGTRFIAEKNKNSIWIKNENNETLFFTACGQNLDNGFFKFNFNISKELQTAKLAVKLIFTKAAVQNLCPKKA